MTSETVHRQSDRDAWSGFNLGRTLFSGIPGYDYFIADLLFQLCRNKKTIVEYGCGDGIWLEYLTKLYPDKQFHGVEWNSQVVKYAKEKRLQTVENVTLHCEDATQFAVDCDMFFAFGVVEHFSNATEVIRKWTEHLSPNGFAVLTVPNLLNAIYTSNRVNLPLEKILYEDEVVEESYGFEQLWSHNMFIRKVIDAGLEILLFRVIDELETEKPLLIVAFKRLKRGEKLGI